MNPQDSAILAHHTITLLSEWFDKYPGKFLGAAASIPMNNIDALERIERAITQLGFKGIVVHTRFIVRRWPTGRKRRKFGITMRTLDSSEFWPIYEAMSKY